MPSQNVRVVTNGVSVFMPIEQAQTLASEQNCDLVEVAPGVYRILDIQKKEYQKKKQKKPKKNTTKELQFSLHIADADRQRKIRDICKWLSQGNSVRVIVRLRGREITKPEVAVTLLNDIVDNIKATVACNCGKISAPQDNAEHCISMMLIPNTRRAL